MVISLTGFMGCGKSSVGRELEALLGCPAVDLDGVIEQRSGRKISEIFESDGEAAFRQMELEALREILDSVSENGHSKIDEMEAVSNEKCGNIGKTGIDLILSLGGGTLTTPECAGLVHEKTTCMYLRAGIDTLVENLEEDGVADRPMLNGTSLRERITELMNARKDSYEKTAHYIIDIDGETPCETAEKISELISPKGSHQNPERAKNLHDPSQTKGR